MCGYIIPFWSDMVALGGHVDDDGIGTLIADGPSASGKSWLRGVWRKSWLYLWIRVRCIGG